MINYLKLVKSQTKKVCLELPLKNINSLCGPEVLWQAIPKVRTKMAECSLAMRFGPHPRNN